MSQSDTGVDQQISLGKQLRSARENRGDSLLAAAQALKLPTSVIESIERDQFDRLGAAIYARGHVRAYVRWLNLPDSAVDRMAPAEEPTPTLQPSVRVSRSRIWLERNAMRAVYVVLTASIILPALWVANERSALDAWRSGRSLDELNVPLVSASQDDQADVAQNIELPSDTAGSHSATLDAEAPTPVMAALTPFPNKGAEAKSVESKAEGLEEGWTFEFVGDSWVEIEGPNGRLEYGLLRKGETRHYSTDQLSRVALGNVHAVELRFAGEPVALDQVTRANVARFTVSSAGEISGDPR